MENTQFEDRVQGIVKEALHLPIEDREHFVLEACGEDKQLFTAVWAIVKEANDAFWEKVKSIVDEALDLPREKREAHALEASKGDETLFKNAMIWIQAEQLDLPIKLERLKPGTLISNRYSIESDGPIGEGGMGEVYKARHLNVDRLVALKRLTNLMPVSIHQFHKEAKLLAKLDHKGIPTVYDHFNEGNEAFLVMNYVPGDDLWVRTFKQKERFAIPDILDWAKQLLTVLDYLHTFNLGSEESRTTRPGSHQTHPTAPATQIPKTVKVGESGAVLENVAYPARAEHIIHRDIKPGNIKVNGSRLYLLDFGIAKGPVTGPPDSSAFTPHYAAPEQILQGETSIQSDLYSAGATLYALITGTAPVRADMRSVDRDPLRPVHEIRKDLPYGLSALIRKAMDIDPDKRPKSAKEMLAELEKIRHLKKRVLRMASVTLSVLLIVGFLTWVMTTVSGPQHAISEMRVDSTNIGDSVIDSSEIEVELPVSSTGSAEGEKGASDKPRPGNTMIAQNQEPAPGYQPVLYKEKEEAEANRDSLLDIPSVEDAIIRANLIMVSDNFPVSRGYILINGDSVGASKWLNFPFGIQSYRIETSVNGYKIQKINVSYGTEKNNPPIPLSPDSDGGVTLVVKPDMVNLRVAVHLEKA